MIKGEKNFLNYLNTPEDWDYEGKYNIPVIPKINVTDKFNPKFIEFHETHRIPKEKRKQYIVHFFLPDFLFERTWSRTEQVAGFLKDFKAVLSPDFSQYTDMPRAMQIWNVYRKSWVSKYWSELGIKVIPVAGWSDEESFEYCFDGMPKDSLIAVSSVGVHNDFEARELFKQGYNKMVEVLEPRKILFYGRKFDWIDDTVIHCPHSRDEKFKAIKAVRDTKAQPQIPVAEQKLLE